MDFLTVVGIIIAAVFVLILVAVVIVVFGGVNDLHKNEKHKPQAMYVKSMCPDCEGLLWAVRKDYPGLYKCYDCGKFWQRYQDEPLIEVFGTPIDKEGGNND